MTDGDHRGDEGAWRPPEEPSTTPSPSEEPPPPPPPVAARRTSEPPPPGADSGLSGAEGDPPPFDEEEGGRKLRPKLVLAIIAAVLVIAIPVGLAIVAAMSAPDTEEQTATDVDGPDEPDDTEAPDEDADELAADLDLDALSGRDEAFGRLLVQVDASERAMIGFQGTVEDTFADAGGTEPEELIERIRTAAETGSEGLADVRPGLATEIDDPDADEVRSVYLEHHDVWADYLETVAENPAVLAGEDGAQWSLMINASAEAFERALREHLDDGLDDEVHELGQSILDRGFDRGDIRPDA